MLITAYEKGRERLFDSLASNSPLILIKKATDSGAGRQKRVYHKLKTLRAV